MRWFILILLVVAGCNAVPGSPTPTADIATFPPPPELAITVTPTAPPMAEGTPTATAPDEVWLESQFGDGAVVAVLHYTTGAEGGKPCVRFLVTTEGSQPHSRCAESGAGVVAVFAVERDGRNDRYTLLAGRALNPAIRTVVIVMQDGESFPITVDAGGFFLILAGERIPTQAVPIDEFGNTIGAIYSF